MEGLTALFTGGALAILSGTTALAFKHPEAFAKLYPFLNLGASIVFLSLSIWEVAVHVTWTGLLPFVTHGQLEAARLAKSDLALPYVWICSAYGGLLVFFWVNVKLPVFIKNVGTTTNGA